jgi:hypothetical protein
VCLTVMTASQRRTGWYGRAAIGVLAVGFLVCTPGVVNQALLFGNERRERADAFFADVRQGLSLEALVARHGTFIYEDDARDVPDRLRALASARLGPFAMNGTHLTPYTGPLRAVVVTSTVIGTQDVAWRDQEGSGVGQDPQIVFALPKRTEAIALRVRVRLTTDSNEPGAMQIFWAGGGQEFSERRAAAFWVPGDGSSQELTVWVFQSVASWRLDPVSTRIPFKVTLERVELLLPLGS